MPSTMRVTLFSLLLAYVTIATSAAPGGAGGKGGKAGKCRNREPPCADGSYPQCSDGSKPDRSTRPPSCAGGESPLCKDGSEPQRPSSSNDDGKDGNDRDEDCTRSGKDPKVFVMCAVGGAVLLICSCACLFCWHRAAKLAKANPKVAEQVVMAKAVDGGVMQVPEMQGTIVAGHPTNHGDFGNGKDGLNKGAAPAEGV